MIKHLKGVQAESVILNHQETSPSSELGRTKLYSVPEQITGGNDTDVKFLLQSDSTEGNTSFSDTSSLAHSITNNSGLVTHTLSPAHSFSPSVIDFPGAVDDYLYSTSSDYIIGDQPWTIDYWLYVTSQANAEIWNVGDIGAAIYNNSFRFYVIAAYKHNVSYAAYINKWTHIAHTYDGITSKTYFDGTFIVSKVQAIDNSGNTCYIGQNNNLAYDNLTGQIAEYRVSIGTVRWEDNFTPPTTGYSSEGILESLAYTRSGGIELVVEHEGHTHDEFDEKEDTLWLIREISASDNVLSTDKIIHVDTTSAVTITWPTIIIAQSGFHCYIKDSTGNADNQNITIATEGSETIENQATIVINQAYGGVEMYSDGTNLFIQN